MYPNGMMFGKLTLYMLVYDGLLKINEPNAAVNSRL
jgi:hypothetical protein